MLTDFFFKLREAQIPVSITEYLHLLDALDKHLAGFSVDDFYYLARAVLIKDERYYDRFDQVFGAYMHGRTLAFNTLFGEIPAEWLQQQAGLLLTEEEKQKIQSLGGWEKLMETLQQRLQEQKEQHHGGSKWIGTGGTSPFGHSGYHPEGVRIGGESKQQRAVKVWEQRQFRNFDDTAELGTRNIKLALRKLRRFARDGAAEELDLDDTIRATARQAGLLDIKMVPERHNAVKVLLFFDVGGSMDDHIQVCEELFSAARTEFKHLEYYYFHNCLYESVWRDNRRRYTERTPTWQIMHTYASDYKLIFVGDATMSPYEISYAGGSVEHMNQEPGAVWIKRMLETYPHAIWLNPQPVSMWEHTPSIKIIRQLLDERMFPLSLDGLDEGIKALKHRI